MCRATLSYTCLERQIPCTHTHVHPNTHPNTHPDACSCLCSPTPSCPDHAMSTCSPTGACGALLLFQEINYEEFVNVLTSGRDL